MFPVPESVSVRISPRIYARLYRHVQMPPARLEEVDAWAQDLQSVGAEQGGRQQHLANALETSHMWVQLDAPSQQQEEIEREARAAACARCIHHV